MAGSSLEAHEAALQAMEYLQAGARRTAAEIMAAFAAYNGGAASEANSRVAPRLSQRRLHASGPHYSPE